VEGLTVVAVVAWGFAILIGGTFVYYWARALMEVVRTPAAAFEAAGTQKSRWVLAMFASNVYAPYRWHHSRVRRLTRERNEPSA
jgi:hypothetical protein